MNVRRAAWGNVPSFGDTWTPYYGRRANRSGVMYARYGFNNSGTAFPSPYDTSEMGDPRSSLGTTSYLPWAVPKDTAEAIEAYRHIMLLAAGEDKANKTFFMSKWTSAKKSLASYTPYIITRIAAATVRTAQNTYKIADDLRVRTEKAYPPTGAKKGKGPGQSESFQYKEDDSTDTSTEKTSQSFLDQLPSWAPWAAGATLLGTILLFAFSRPRGQVVYQREREAA